MRLARRLRIRTRLSIAVNISPLDLQDQALPARLAALLAKYRVDPGQLQLEVTETGLMSSGADPVAVPHALKSWGVMQSIVGVGQSLGLTV